MALGDLYWEKKNFTKSKEYFEKGFQCYDGLRTIPSIANLARDYLSYADLLTKKGDRLKARENLGKAIETFKGCGADGWVEEAEKDLASLA